LHEENIVKKTCKELGVTQKELANITSISLPTIQRWSSSNKIPKQNIIFLELLIKNHNIQNELDEIKKFFQTFEKYSSVIKGSSI
jgi:predicted transcriptional regulator